MLCQVMGNTMAISTGELEKTFPGMIKMNESASDIWKWIDAGKEPEEIYGLYSETYGVDAQVAKEDVDSVVEQMSKAGVFE